MLMRANIIPVTTALREIITKHGIKPRWIFSDSTKPKGFTKAVGVKLAGEYHTQQLIDKVVADMTAKGYVHIRTKITDYRQKKGYRPWGGTRYTFAQPKYKIKA
jgi:hypothetical protein